MLQEMTLLKNPTEILDPVSVAAADRAQRWSREERGPESRSLEGAFGSIFWMLCQGVVELLEPVCESPIEVRLGSALLVYGSIMQPFSELQDGETKQVFKLQSTDSDARSASVFGVFPQYRWRRFRVDFAILTQGHDSPCCFIECDGHEFHERTPEQAARDRSRDRACQLAGVPVLRFTGREIYRDPFAVAVEISKLCHKRKALARVAAHG
jgi:very-short-patch-repair endonuclease